MKLIKTIMKKYSILFFVLLLVTTLQAQQVKYICNNVPMKEKQTVKSKIIGNIDSSVYVATTNKKSDALRLSKYDSKTTILSKSILVQKLGKKENNSLLSKAKYSETIIRNNKLYIVWLEENKNESKLTLQIFDNELNEIQKPQLLYLLPNNGRFNSKAHPFFLISPDGSKIIVGGEENTKNGTNIKLQYKLMDGQLNVQNMVQAELPYSTTIYSSGLSSNYKISDQGVLYFNTNVVFSGNFTENTKGSLIGKIQPENSEVKFQVLSFENKEISDFNYEINDDCLSIFGTYTSRNKPKTDKNVEKINFGVYLGKINKNSFEFIDEIIFSQITAEKIVFSDFTMKENDKKKYSIAENALNKIKDNLVITDYIVTSDGEILLTLNNQVQTLVCENVCNPYTNVYSVNYMKLSKKGDIRWISCTEVHAQYPEFRKFNKNLIHKDGKYYTIINGDKNKAYAIDEKSGMVEKSTLFSKKYKDETAVVLNNQLFFTATTNKISSFGIATAILLPTAILIGGIHFLLIDSPIMMAAIPALPSSVYFPILLMRNHNVYFGKYDINTDH